MIKLLSGQRYKGGTRVTMVCGFRALEDYNQKSDQTGAISVLLSARQTEIADAVLHEKEELSYVKGQLANLRQQLFQIKASQLEEHTPNVCMFEPDLNRNEIRTLMNLCMEKCDGICAVFSGTDEEGYQYVAGSRTKDMLAFGKALQEAFAGRGGGKTGMIQGSIQGTQSAIEAWILHKAAEN